MYEFVIININSKFAAERPRRTVWVAEYPDATIWMNERDACRALRRLKHGGHAANIYSVIENYGTESRRTVERLDLLADGIKS